MTKEARIDNGEKTVFKKWCWENWKATSRRMIAQQVKNPPEMQETQVWSLGCEDPLEREVATHCSILAWEIPWTERSLAGYSSWGHRELDRIWQLKQQQWLVMLIILPCAYLLLYSHRVVSDSLTPWTAARQASLSFTISQSLLRFMPTEWVMPSNHLILCRPLLLLPSIFPSSRLFFNESVLQTRWPE